MTCYGTLDHWLESNLRGSDRCIHDGRCIVSRWVQDNKPRFMAVKCAYCILSLLTHCGKQSAYHGEHSVARSETQHWTHHLRVKNPGSLQAVRAVDLYEQACGATKQSPSLFELTKLTGSILYWREY